MLTAVICRSSFFGVTYNWSIYRKISSFSLVFLNKLKKYSECLSVHLWYIKTIHWSNLKRRLYGVIHTVSSKSLPDRSSMLISQCDVIVLEFVYKIWLLIPNKPDDSLMFMYRELCYWYQRFNTLSLPAGLKLYLTYRFWGFQLSEKP